MTDPEQAMFEAIAQQLCAAIDRLTTAVGEGTRRLEVAIGGLEVEVGQMHEEIHEIGTSLLELEELARIKNVVKGIRERMPR
jgi:hypothetical protein